LRFAAQIGRFPPFPNPHLRSNALLLSRNSFLSFAEEARFPVRKNDAHFRSRRIRAKRNFRVVADHPDHFRAKDGTKKTCLRDDAKRQVNCRV
jgi:hypothetical protein